MNDFIKQRYIGRLNARMAIIKESNLTEHQMLRSFASLMKEFGSWEEEALPCCLMLQDTLYDMRIIYFKILSVDDGIKLNNCTQEEKEILQYVWFAFCRKTDTL